MCGPVYLATVDLVHRERRSAMRVVRVFVGSLVVLGLVVIGLPSSFAGAGGLVGDPEARTGGGGTVYYLALGTSLAVGYQPGRGETDKGYVDDLWRSVGQQIPSLDLRNVGCPGETTRSMITGKHSLCHYAAGSQLDAAVAFLTAHPGQVAFITLEVGANDLVDHCFDDRTGLIDKACAADLSSGLESRLNHIADALATAGPGVPIVAMTYYDPFLGLWGLIPGGRALAHADQRAWRVFNGALATAYEGAGATVADVAATFRIDDFADTVKVPGRGRIPVNVALTCKWTWFCTPKFFPDPHANQTGYRKIARTFYRELQTLLP
jgi:lysophospholipase L1-like esterase